MKSGFSTLGCPAWDVDRIASCVEQCGYRALELRGLEREMFLPSHPALATEARAAFRSRFESLGCTIACLGSSAHLTAPPSPARDQSTDEVRAYVDLASDLGCDTVRIFAGRIHEPDDRETSGRRITDHLAELEPHARAAGVRLAVETHDDWCRAQDLAPAVRGVGSPSVGVLWDLNHPYRHGEPPEVTARELRDLLFHVHTKDGVEGEGYTLFGEGDLPLREMLALLHAMGYAGVLSLEWEKRWHPEIAEPDVALPHYARTLSAMLQELGIPDE